MSFNLFCLTFLILFFLWFNGHERDSTNKAVFLKILSIDFSFARLKDLYDGLRRFWEIILKWGRLVFALSLFFLMKFSRLDAYFLDVVVQKIYKKIWPNFVSSFCTFTQPSFTLALCWYKTSYKIEFIQIKFLSNIMKNGPF